MAKSSISKEEFASLNKKFRLKKFKKKDGVYRLSRFNDKTRIRVEIFKEVFGKEDFQAKHALEI